MNFCQLSDHWTNYWILRVCHDNINEVLSYKIVDINLGLKKIIIRNYGFLYRDIEAILLKANNEILPSDMKTSIVVREDSQIKNVTKHGTSPQYS